MKQIKNNVFLLVVISVLLSCNDTTTPSETNDMDIPTTASNVDEAAMPPYDAAMDPVNGAGINMLQDSLGVKMYEFTVNPGESWPLHNHPDHIVYFLQGGKIALFVQAAGKQDTMTIPTGMSIISGPMSDSGKNIGNTTIKMLVADIYRSPNK